MSIFPTKIFVATDGSEEAQLASRTALDLANQTGSELHVVYVEEFWPTIFAYTEEELERLERNAQRLLDKEAEKIRAAGGRIVETYLRLGKPDEQIVGLGEQIGAGLIVMGSRGLGGMTRALMGSVSDSLVRHAHCPVLVTRTEEKNEEVVGIFPTKILLATDGSEEATLAARTAADIADKTTSELHVVYTEPVPVYGEFPSGRFEISEDVEKEVRNRAQRFLDDQVKQIKADGGTVAQAHLRMGRSDEEIVTLGQEIGVGLIVMGSRGLGRMLRTLMGSVSDSVVRHAHCPVLVVREEKR